MTAREQDLDAAIRKAHGQAEAAGLDRYRDPQTGYTVFTRGYHLRRGYCCGSGCRHCPYDPGERDRSRGRSE